MKGWQLVNLLCDLYIPRDNNFYAKPNSRNAKVPLASKVICHLLEKKMLDSLFKLRLKFTKPISTNGIMLVENPNKFMGLDNLKYFL